MAKNVEGRFLAGEIVKGSVKIETPNGHVEAGPKSRLYGASIDTPAPENPVPRHFPGSWTFK